MIRKSFAIIFAAAVLTVSPVYAFDHDNFSIYSMLFGASDIDDAQADIVNDCARYYQDDCVITFRYDGETVKTIMVEGEGDKFLAYCYGALFQFDPDTKNADKNGGRLLGSYLMGHDERFNGKPQYTASGVPFTVTKKESKYSFIISSGSD